MRILRGLSSRLLLCGCLAGVYETYDNQVVGIVDAQGAACADPAHRPGHTLTAADMNGMADADGRVTIGRTTPS